MSDTVIKVENLSKKYVIGHQRTERYQTFRDTMAAQVKGLGRRLVHPFRNSEGGLMASDETEEFYALRDVSFEIKRGERVGIIGRNGAGKSTLLKILSRITEPTSGRIEIDGRVASLLEVGTGFHPELTGRENIFLNGAILGMTREEIKRKFDEIVTFAEIEKFLDTPVKRYSSGMYVRLAFSVAAHLEPEILVVDEVLAVGDVEFQKKCLGKMKDVADGGRTILLVSHNIGAFRALCKSALFLNKGEVQFSGSMDQGIDLYLSSGNTTFDGNSFNSGRYDSAASLISASIASSMGTGNIFSIDESVLVELKFNVFQPHSRGYYPNIHLFNSDGAVCFVSNPTETKALTNGLYLARCLIPPNLLNAGTYRATLVLSSVNGRVTVHSQADLALSFTITDHLRDKETRMPYYTGPYPGVVRPSLEWSMEKVE